MNSEEKILTILDQMNSRMDQMSSRMDQMNSRMDQMQADLSGRIDQVQADLNGRMDQMQEDISGLKDTQAKQGETLSDLQKTVTRVALTQENIVLKSLDALADGQDLTHQRMKDLAGKDEVAELREEVRLLRSVVAQHARDIEALKAAQ